WKHVKRYGVICFGTFYGKKLRRGKGWFVIKFWTWIFRSKNTIEMVKEFEKYRYWAVILGGSSGLGLASAKKLAQHGMNICIIHQNTRVEMEKINLEFE